MKVEALLKPKQSVVQFRNHSHMYSILYPKPMLNYFGFLHGRSISWWLAGRRKLKTIPFGSEHASQGSTRLRVKGSGQFGARFGSPYSKDYSAFGSILGLHVVGNTQIMMVVYWKCSLEPSVSIVIVLTHTLLSILKMTSTSREDLKELQLCR